MTDATSGPAFGEGAPQGQTPRQPAAPLNYYDLLGLGPSASPQDIRRAYRDLSKLYHPDTTQLERAIATAKFQVLNEAYATLSSPEKRLTYDYKIGYSRLSVIQPLSSQQSQRQSAQPGKSSAYLDPTDRPLSAGELFALFILGITFIGCLILVVTISLTRGDITLTTLDPAPTVSSQLAPTQSVTTPESASIHQPIAPKMESLPE